MNILYLIHYAGAAGTEKYVETLMAAAGREGHVCHLGYTVAGGLSESVQCAGFPVLQLDMRPRRIISAAVELAEYCREHSIGVIHAQFPRENVIALLAKRQCPGLRVVFTSHLTIRQGLHWRLLNRMLTPGNHRVIAVCRQGVPVLRRNGVCPARIQVIPNGIDAGLPMERQDVVRQEFGLPPGAFVFLTVGRFAPEKGYLWLMDVLARLRELSDKPFVCLMAGQGEEFEAVTAKIARRGLEKHVIQAGFRSDVPRLLASSDAYVSSSLREAMSFSILEAMAAGLPLAVTEAGAGEELAQGCGFAAKPGDTETMAHHLRTLLEDPALCRRLGQKAREKVCRDYNLDSTLQQTLESYG